MRKSRMTKQTTTRRPGRPRTRFPMPGESLADFARRRHEAIPLTEAEIEAEAAAKLLPAEKYAKRRRGGRPLGVRMSLELRIRRAARLGYVNLQLSGADVLELHALYNIINPAGDLFRNENAYRGGSGNSQVAGSARETAFDFDGQINARWLRMTVGQLMVRAAAAATEEEDAIGKR